MEDLHEAKRRKQEEQETLKYIELLQIQERMEAEQRKKQSADLQSRELAEKLQSEE